MNISELIQELQKYPADKQVVIEDADTNWIGPTIYIEEYSSCVTLSIIYSEMESERMIGGRLS